MKARLAPGADLAFSIRYICNIATFFAFFFLFLLTILQDLQIWAEKFLSLHYQKTKTLPQVKLTEREMRILNEAANITLHETAKKVRLTELVRERTNKKRENLLREQNSRCSF